MGRVLFAGSAVVFFALALIVLLATSGGERLVATLTVTGLACLSIAVLIHLSDARR